MGSVSLKAGDGTARFKRATICASALNGLMLFSVLITNLFALYAFTYHPRNATTTHPHLHPKNISIISKHVSVILNEIQSSQKQLNTMGNQILGYDTVDRTHPGIPAELKLFLTPHTLPLGKDSKTGITELVSSIGHSCARSMDMLSQYMSYKALGRCPDDRSLAQKLILRGCEPLPKRRCFASTNAKSFGGKVKKSGAVGRDTGFSVDDVLGLGDGLIRIGLDIGGGVGSFAARMGHKGVTVMTQSLNPDGPESETIAARGLFPLFLSLDHRLPFYDNVFDLIHAGSGLNDGGRADKLEFLMFDVDRVLRAGGLLWLENYCCTNDDKKRGMMRLVERFGYNKLKWVVEEKPGSEKLEVYLSAVLQKPIRA